MALGSFSKADKKNISGFTTTLATELDSFSELCEKERTLSTEAEYEALRTQVREALEKLNSLCEEASDWFEAFKGEQEDAMSDKSEKWQESDKAQEVQSFLDGLDDLCDFSPADTDLNVVTAEAGTSYPKLVDLDKALDYSSITEYREALDSLEY